MKKGNTSLFRSPPDPQSRSKELAFEAETATIKRTLFLQQIQKMHRIISSQFTNDRQAQITIDTLTSEKNHKHSFTHQMQESILTKAHVQNVIYQRIRQYHDVLLSDPMKFHRFKEWASRSDHDFVARVIFPFGMKHEARHDPRTPELADSSSANGSGDGDASLSIDALACALCHKSHATDDNDLVMCDGAKCCRAFHVHCGKISPKELEEDDWFCFICKGMADLLSHTQELKEGEEWEQRRIQLRIENDDVSLSTSLKSWSGVSDVFPNAPDNYRLALAYSQGRRTAEIEQYVSQILGIKVEFDDDDDQYESDQEDENSSTESTEGELVITKAEIDALSDVSDLDDESSFPRRIRRRQRRPSAEIDIGKLDEANILLTSRKRKFVDYRKLNDDLFGHDQNSAIDDDQDFEKKGGTVGSGSCQSETSDIVESDSEESTRSRSVDGCRRNR